MLENSEPYAQSIQALIECYELARNDLLRELRNTPRPEHHWKAMDQKSAVPQALAGFIFDKYIHIENSYRSARALLAFCEKKLHSDRKSAAEISLKIAEEENPRKRLFSAIDSYMNLSFYPPAFGSTDQNYPVNPKALPALRIRNIIDALGEKIEAQLNGKGWPEPNDIGRSGR